LGRYAARRLLQALLTLLLVMGLLHVLTTFTVQLNDSPARAFFGDRSPTASQLAAVEARYNLNDPCYDHVGNPCVGPFVERLGQYARGDFGEDFRGRAVTELVAVAAPNTLRLFAVVTITWLIMGLLLGSVAARYRGRAADHSIRFTSILIDAFPVFVMLLVYKYVVAVPVGTWMRDRFGSDSFLGLLFKPSFDPNHPWATVIIPGILLGATGSAAFIRLVRASQLENYGADHVRAAKAKGMSSKRLIVFHILRNSSIPVATAVGFVFAEALSGAVITEGIMNIHGMGGLLWNSVRESVTPVVVGVVTLLAILVLIVNIAVDFAYAALDPRIRYG
jgi:ABC-type dipeptide/oligopeptide/nickel transport system permease component